MDISDWLKRVSFMPGWEIMRIGTHPEGEVIAISFEVPDAREPGVQVQNVVTLVPPCQTAGQFYDWLDWRLQRIAIHEVHEFFKVDGELWNDPHTDLASQVYS